MHCWLPVKTSLPHWPFTVLEPSLFCQFLTRTYRLVLFNNTQKQSPKSSQSRELVDTTSFLPQSRPHTVLESMLGWLGPQCVVGSPAGFFSTLIFHTLCVFTCKKFHNIYTFIQIYSQGTFVFCIVFILYLYYQINILTNSSSITDS